MIKKIKKISKRIISLMLVTSIFLGSSLTASAADDWEGWNDETEEEAYTVYGLTNWNDVGSFLYGADGSIALSSVPDIFKNDEVEDETIEAICNRIGNEFGELLLCVVYVLNSEGNNLSYVNSFHDKGDIAYYYPLIANPEGKKHGIDEEKSISLVYSRLESSYSAFNSKHKGDERASLYRVDDKLKAVVQGVIYDGYSKSTDAYSRDDAKNYAKNNDDKMTSTAKSLNSFAEDVVKYYSAIESSGRHIIKG